ncbi:MAG: hypothetical protein RIT45_4191, partial [Pseudomonadota bacterium]
MKDNATRRPCVDRWISSRSSCVLRSRSYGSLSLTGVGRVGSVDLYPGY